MNTKWEETFDEKFDGLWLDGMTNYETDKSYDKEETIKQLKAFIKDQITKAYEEGRAHYSFNGKDPLEVRGVYLNNLVKEAQQEIAEQIIEDIRFEATEFIKDQLRKKYLL